MVKNPLKNIFRISKEDKRAEWTSEQWRSYLIKNASTASEEIEIQAIFSRQS